MERCSRTGRGHDENKDKPMKSNGEHKEGAMSLPIRTRRAG